MFLLLTLYGCRVMVEVQSNICLVAFWSMRRCKKEFEIKNLFVRGGTQQHENK